MSRANLISMPISAVFHVLLKGVEKHNIQTPVVKSGSKDDRQRRHLWRKYEARGENHRLCISAHQLCGPKNVTIETCGLSASEVYDYGYRAHFIE